LIFLSAGRILVTFEIDLEDPPMAESQERAGSQTSSADAKPKTESAPGGIDRNAPAGAPNSLGAESIRDGRPSTDDSVVEAIDEEGPGIDPVD
jgi:hypothetical protein